MATTPAQVLKQLEALDDDFMIFSSRKSPPTKAQIDAVEKKLGTKFRDDHRALLRTLGCAAVMAKEEVWPRAKEFDVRPLWQFQYGIEVFGVDPESKAPPLDLIVQVKERAPKDRTKLVPFFRKLGDRFCIGYDAKGRLHEWEPGAEPSLLGQEDPLALLSATIAQLVTDKEKMKKEGPANASKSDEAGEEPTLEALLAATKGKEPDDGAIWALGKLATKKPALDRLLALAKHTSEEVRDTAVTVLGTIESHPHAAVPVLCAALADKNEDVRNSAADALKSYATEDAIEPLKKALSTVKRSKRWVHGVLFGNVLEALGTCGAGKPDVIDLVVANLELEDRYASRHAFEALMAMGAKAKRAVPALERLVKHEDRYREIHARHALAVITGNVTPHVPYFHSALKVKEAGGATAAAASIAMRKLGLPEPTKKKR